MRPRAAPDTSTGVRERASGTVRASRRVSVKAPGSGPLWEAGGRSGKGPGAQLARTVGSSLEAIRASGSAHQVRS